MQMNHVTLNGRTFHYTTTEVYMGETLVYSGTVTYGLLIKLSQVLGA